MGSKYRIVARVSLASIAAVLAIAPAVSQQSDPPIARYTMDAGTLSGMAAMAGGRGGGIGGIMSMMNGGGGSVAHELVLRLGSSRTPAGGDPDADHFMPQGARLGTSVPLTYRRTQGREGSAPQGELPRGRLLLFWGCGEHAPAGQPVILDFSRLARGEIPPDLYAQGLNLPSDWTVRPDNSTTYGDWPNSEDAQVVQGNASLLGQHRVASNYAPEISFNLAQDFMPALQPTGSDLASGAVAMRWNSIDVATGYYAWAVGAGGNERDMVWWTSASTQQFGGPFADWVSPASARRYIEAGTVMPPTQTSCTIPAEVREAAGEGMMSSLYAFGPEVDFAYPPRPEDSRTPWRPEWIARVRYRSMAMVIPGMEMPGMDGSDFDSADSSEPDEPAGLPRCRGGLRGIAERAAGLCS
ncbi:hypothetical protein [Alteraurantiacibacter aquimixticola]|uniref:DUF946 domain-containing protein n=1 Tax=Alteraurantiacibacter aquimixticola TaxID=2489173 RepID=A0A4T3F6T1_9SPHN|nr:hypothetical protein [Alteraurantiacibacter aquimixticola]TIX50566.1 hypothetical protein E5222_09880 [Alteraurantiacibacter aquimixticola]